MKNANAAREKPVIDLLEPIVGIRWAKRLAVIYPTPRAMRNVDTQRLLDIGLPVKKAELLSAAIEFGWQCIEMNDSDNIINSPVALYESLRRMLREPEYEQVGVIYVNNARKSISKQIHSVGSQTNAIMDARKLLREGLRLGATGFLIGHNHPSGDPRPSQNDIDVTVQVYKASQVLGMPLLDHMIISDGRTKYHSMRESHTWIWA